MAVEATGVQWPHCHVVFYRGSCPPPARCCLFRDAVLLSVVPLLHPEPVGPFTSDLPHKPGGLAGTTAEHTQSTPDVEIPSYM